MEDSRAIRYEEFFNSLTHGAGVLLSVACLAVMVIFASLHGNARHVVGCSVFGVSLVLLYTASTLYHSAHSPRLKHIFKTMDHACIYLLIAGTYTPFMLVTLQGRWGWSLLGIVWGIALLGIVFKIFFVYRFRTAATVAYILMGWLAVVAIKPLLANLSAAGLAWLVAGGLSYTVGAVFYLMKRLPYSHAIWHIFVLGGSLCHFFAVLFHVIPAGNG
ncbi:MAG: hemolysin D [Deltaproteobacteria bacterium HGW-Deltaproteobacteria-19]|jgi:hemolysin III|nr:MAG: hemolysin D [Deltaproteobacteria bacterium HGW-Deltaproteobacteria-19]